MNYEICWTYLTLFTLTCLEANSEMKEYKYNSFFKFEYSFCQNCHLSIYLSKEMQIHWFETTLIRKLLQTDFIISNTEIRQYWKKNYIFMNNCLRFHFTTSTPTKKTKKKHLKQQNPKSKFNQVFSKQPSIEGCFYLEIY